MVLEGATSDASDWTSDNVFQRGDDLHSTSQNPTAGIDIGMLCNPMPIFGPLMGYTPNNLRESLDIKIESFAAVVQRPLAVAEREAIAQHYSRAYSLCSWGMPSGMMAGAYAASRARSQLRLPFYTLPATRFAITRLGPFRGVHARLAWLLLRGSTYLSLGGVLGSELLKNLAMVVAWSGLFTDGRLAGLNRAIADQAARLAPPPQHSSSSSSSSSSSTGSSSSPEPGATIESPPESVLEVLRAGEISRERHGDAPSSLQAAGRCADGGGMYTDSVGRADDGWPTDTGSSLSGYDERKYRSAYKEPSSTSSASSTKPWPDEDAPFLSDSSSSFDPDGPNAPSAKESAWERIRRQGRNGKPPSSS